MEWLQSYYKDLEIDRRLERAYITQKLLEEFKKKYITEKKHELEILEKRIEELKKEIKALT
jgi:hypothetical protein